MSLQDILNTDNIGLSRITINNNLHYLLSLINSNSTGLKWIKNVLDITTSTLAAPGDGNRYISSETSNGWTKDYIYEYDADDDEWDEFIPDLGTSTWVDDVSRYYVYNGSEWVQLGTVISHNALSGLNVDDFQHLTAIEKSDLTGGGDANAQHGHDNETSIPSSFPNANGIKGQWAIDNVNQFMYFCISNNLWVRWTIETA